MPIVDNFIFDDKKFNPLKNRLLINVFCIILITGYALDVIFAKLPTIVIYFNFLNILLSLILIILFFLHKITIPNIIRLQVLGLIANLLLSSFFNPVDSSDFASMFVRNVIIIFILVPVYGIYCGKNHIFQIGLGFMILYSLILIRGENQFLINNAPFLVFSAFIYHFGMYYIFDIIEKMQLKQIELSDDLKLQKDSLFTKNNDLKQKNEHIKQQSRELTQLLNTKDKLFSIIAHDLRGPVAGISGVSEILSQNIQDYDKEEIKVLIEEVHVSSKRTLNLLENLLIWANLQTGKIDYYPESFNLNVIILDIIDILNSSAKIKNITINYIPLDDNFDLYADKNMIHTILRNLISNAIKFTNSGGKINIIVKKNEIHYEIIISDNGIGIMDDVKNNLFCINSQISALGTKGEKGSGLGLVICKEFVEKHGGKIWFESQEGKGSDFKVIIPIVQA